MKINYKIMNFAFYIVAILLIVSMNMMVYIIGASIKISIILLSFSLLLFIGMFLHQRLYKNYMKEIFVQLSDMLDLLIDMRDGEVFSTLQDTMLSKLQHQTIKLASILKEKNKQIEKDRNEIKTLISDISHQLKTPITNLKMYEELLQDEGLSEQERKEFNRVIMLSLDRLSFLIESIIKMSRLEGGVIQLKPQLNDLKETILLAVNQVQKKAAAKNIQITLEETDQVMVKHDKNWMAEAIFNILENAVKYTGENGSIDITMQCYEMFVRVDMKDNGIGIKEDELPRIFARFYRGRNVGEADGIGIGLYLTREIVGRHGGYIKVSSNDSGSMFSLFLPNN